MEFNAILPTRSFEPDIASRVKSAKHWTWTYRICLRVVKRNYTHAAIAHQFCLTLPASGFCLALFGNRIELCRVIPWLPDDTADPCTYLGGIHIELYQVLPRLRDNPSTNLQVRATTSLWRWAGTWRVGSRRSSSRGRRASTPSSSSTTASQSEEHLSTQRYIKGLLIMTSTSISALRGDSGEGGIGSKRRR